MAPRSEVTDLEPNEWGITGPPGLRAGTVRSGRHPSSKRTSPPTSPWQKMALTRNDTRRANVTLLQPGVVRAGRVTSPSPQASGSRHPLNHRDVLRVTNNQSAAVEGAHAQLAGVGHGTGSAPVRSPPPDRNVHAAHPGKDPTRRESSESSGIDDNEVSVSVRSSAQASLSGSLLDCGAALSAGARGRPESLVCTVNFQVIRSTRACPRRKIHRIGRTRGWGSDLQRQSLPCSPRASRRQSVFSLPGQLRPFPHPWALVAMVAERRTDEQRQRPTTPILVADPTLCAHVAGRLEAKHSPDDHLA